MIAKTWPVDRHRRRSARHVQDDPAAAALPARQRRDRPGLRDRHATGRNQGRTRVMVVDVTNREGAEIKRIIDVEGRSASSRSSATILHGAEHLARSCRRGSGDRAEVDREHPARRQPQSLRPWEIQARLAATMRPLLANITQADVAIGAAARAHRRHATKQMACEDLYVPQRQPAADDDAREALAHRAERPTSSARWPRAAQSTRRPTRSTCRARTTPGTTQGAASYGTQVHQFSLGDASSRARPTSRPAASRASCSTSSR